MILLKIYKLHYNIRYIYEKSYTGFSDEQKILEMDMSKYIIVVL